VEVPPDWSFAVSVAEGSVVGKEMDRVVLEKGAEFGKGGVWRECEGGVFDG